MDKWCNQLRDLEGGWSGDTEAFLQKYNVEPTEFDATSLGTIGGGNHFAELQEVRSSTSSVNYQIEEVFDRETFEKLGLDEQFLYLLVHSGSRALGESILREHTDKFDYRGLIENSIEAKEYLKKHDHAVAWAKVNRQLIIHRFLACIQAEHGIDDDEEDEAQVPGESIIDIVHNCVIQKEFFLENDQKTGEEVKKQNLWLHRKGAAPADVGPGRINCSSKFTS